MTVHPQNIPYSDWLGLKKHIYQLFTTGYPADETYKKNLMEYMREIEKQQVEIEKGVEL
jgi:hypothetical protein